MTEAAAARCYRCGRIQDARADPMDALAWVSEHEHEHEHERGRVRHLCPDCARSHTRDIEGKLPDEYW
ncbi:hypothetical protein [Amycolatopsis minnesotensis]|uniref:HNH endonuclease n=1 Tax=Amycolatopsis minnesotensis TaxID=337894 RepID=A0ABN2SWA6_9PSEU